MCEKSTTGWKKTLTNILEELDQDQYKKLLEYLDKIPKSRKNAICREGMPQIIIEHYGEDESILKIKDIMEEIPRRDHQVQDQLRPFVEKVEEKRGKKRKSGTDPESEVDQDSPAGQKKKKTIDPDSDDDDDVKTGDPEGPQSEKKTEVPQLRTTIKLLKETGSPNGKPVGGEVVQKSDLISCKTKNKFFNLEVADETDSIRVMVFGKERFKRFVPGKLYLFEDIVMDVVNGEQVMKVIEKSKISPINKMEGAKTMTLVKSQLPIYSIEKIQSFVEKTSVNVEGTVTWIDSMEQVKLKRQRTKVDKQKFQLKDETGSIWITLWRRETQQLRGTSVGDLVRVTRLMTNLYNEEVSLNSTDFTRIDKV